MSMVAGIPAVASASSLAALKKGPTARGATPRKGRRKGATPRNCVGSPRGFRAAYGSPRFRRNGGVFSRSKVIPISKRLQLTGIQRSLSRQFSKSLHFKLSARIDAAEEDGDEPYQQSRGQLYGEGTQGSLSLGAISSEVFGTSEFALPKIRTRGRLDRTLSWYNRRSLKRGASFSRSSTLSREAMASAAVLSAPAPGSAKGSHLPENSFLGGGANHSQSNSQPLASQLSLEQRFAEEIRNRAEAAIAAANGGQTAVFIEPPPLFHSSRELLDGQAGLGESLLQKKMYIETDVTVDDTGVNAPLQTDVPVYVMLPLDTVRNDGFVNNPRAMEMAFRALKQAGCTGIMIDVWWGIAERNGPGQYDFGAYQHLLQMCKEAGLKMQAVMSFHACGGNVGDNVNIPLPHWVLEAGRTNPEIFYTDRGGYCNQECLSLFSDDSPVLAGRSPLQCYSDYMTAFRAAMGSDFGSVLTEVAVGMGPCGELRYPAYPEGDGRWRFPGVGEFQCYDKRALADLSAAAAAIGKPEWGHGGPHDAGGYHSLPQETGFFTSQGGSWDTPYGRFFLEWYSQSLVKHGDRMMAAACKAFYGAESLEGPKRKQKPGEAKISLKCAGIHWWYKSRSHGAELTAGYYNTRSRNGYAPIIELCQRYSADFNFTCVEMKDCEQPEFARCGPEELLKQVRVCAAQKGVPMAGENALSRLDDHAYEQILDTTCCTGIEIDELDEEGQTRKVKHVVPLMSALTFLRLSPQLLEERHFSRFVQFVQAMKQANGNKPLQVSQSDLVAVKAAQPAIV